MELNNLNIFFLETGEGKKDEIATQWTQPIKVMGKDGLPKILSIGLQLERLSPKANVNYSGGVPLSHCEPVIFLDVTVSNPDYNTQFSVSEQDELKKLSKSIQKDTIGMNVRNFIDLATMFTMNDFYGEYERELLPIPRPVLDEIINRFNLISDKRIIIPRVKRKKNG